MSRIKWGFGVAALAMVVSGVGPAQAATSQCSNGEACVWQNFTYGGSFRGMSATANDYDNIVWEAGIGYGTAITGTSVSSMRNQGNNCQVRFWSSANHTGTYTYFWRVSDGANYQDPNSDNGAGLAPYRWNNWNDTIESHDWIHCA